jgi:hypothetical protein
LKIRKVAKIEVETKVQPKCAIRLDLVYTCRDSGAKKNRYTQSKVTLNFDFNQGKRERDGKIVIPLLTTCQITKGKNK